MSLNIQELKQEREKLRTAAALQDPFDQGLYAAAGIATAVESVLTKGLNSSALSDAAESELQDYFLGVAMALGYVPPEPPPEA
ncbi:hypothetical protein [Ferrimonas pelagia]|uniref:Uncharacterized protein n=1 Tax=Ferrimonas pelagia TaxID=1177826 RepID=A0ABP9FJH4_9GAMM